MLPPEIWSTHQLEESAHLLWQVGSLKLWLQRAGQDWLIAQESALEEADRAEIDREKPLPEDLSWVRWVFNRNFNKVRISPLLPDRALVVRSRNPIVLPPAGEVLFFIDIPSWASITVESKKDSFELTKFPSLVLSNTWFGDQFRGELCYALKSPARRELDTIDYYPNSIICPFVICNDADSPLQFEKICLSVKHLNIYSGTDRLWTNQVTVTFRSETEASHLEYAKTPPPQAKKAALMVEAEEKSEYGFFRRTFGTS